MNDPLMLIFPRLEVESRNIAPLLRRFAPDKLPKGRELAAMMNTFHFAVHGYDDDPHEVYAIAAVRRYYQKLHREWPYAFYFCDLRGESLMSTRPFQLLRNPALRPQFLGDLSALVDGAPFTLFISAIQKQTHLDRYGVNAGNPYDLALEFAMERLIHFLHAEGETSLPIVAEARGRQEDNSLEKTFYRIIAQGTQFRPADEFHRLNLSLTFQPKANNIAGVQLADLCAHPCARHIINPKKENRAFDVARRQV